MRDLPGPAGTPMSVPGIAVEARGLSMAYGDLIVQPSFWLVVTGSGRPWPQVTERSQTWLCDVAA